MGESGFSQEMVYHKKNLSVGITPHGVQRVIAAGFALKNR